MLSSKITDASSEIIQSSEKNVQDGCRSTMNADVKDMDDDFDFNSEKSSSIHTGSNILNNFIAPNVNESINMKLYRRAVSKFLYTMCNQCRMFYSLYRQYELKILCISVRLAYLGMHFTEKHARR